MNNLGGAGDRFGDYLCEDCNNLPCVGGHHEFTKFTKPTTKISKSMHEMTIDDGGDRQTGREGNLAADILFLKHDSSIFRLSSNRV